MFQIIEFFRAWCAQKVGLHFAPRAPLFKQGEVWWCSVGMNVGDEIYGKGSKFRRPVLVFKKLTRTTFFGLPITMREKSGTWYVEICVLEERRWVLLNQARTFDCRRLQRRISVLSEEDFSGVSKRFLEFFSP